MTERTEDRIAAVAWWIATLTGPVLTLGAAGLLLLIPPIRHLVWVGIALWLDTFGLRG